MGKREILLLLITIVTWALTFRKPFWGLLYFLLFSTLGFQYLYVNLEPFHLIRITSIVVLISWFLHSKGGEVKKAPQFYLLVGLFLLMCISRWNAGVPILGHRYMEFYKIVLLFLAMINLITTEERLKIFMWVMIISYATLAFVTRHYWTLTPYYWWNSGDFALALLSIVPLTFFFIFSEKKMLTKLESICYLPVLTLMTLRTGSRGGFLGLAVIFFLFLVHRPTVKKYLILIPIGLILLNRISEKEIQRYQTIKSYRTEMTAQQRIGAWRAGLRMLATNPIFGVGTGEFPTRFWEYADEKTWEIVGRSNAHSMYVQIGAETGLLGLIIFLILIVVTFKDIWRLWLISKKSGGQNKACQMGIAVAIGLIGYLVSGLFLNVGYRADPYILMGLVVAAKEIATKKAMEERVVEEKRVEFPRFNILTRTALLGTCFYLGLY